MTIRLNRGCLLHITGVAGLNPTILNGYTHSPGYSSTKTAVRLATNLYDVNTEKHLVGEVRKIVPCACQPVD